MRFARSESYLDRVSGLKHPARHYAYYLLSKRIFNTNAVIAQMRDLGLAAPLQDSAVELDHFVKGALSVRREMQHPENFNPKESAPNEDTLAFLTRWQIRDAWQQSPYLAKATELLQEPQLRFALELMLLGPMSVMAITRRLQERYGLPEQVMNVGVVRAFKHYYWDPAALSPVQWRDFLEAHHKAESTEYLGALNAPRNIAGAAYVLAIADRDLSLLDAAARYEVASAQSFKQFMALTCNTKPSGNAAFASFAALNAMKLADSELDKYRGATSDLIQTIDRLETIYDKRPSLSITHANFVRPVIETTGENVEEETHENQ